MTKKRLLRLLPFFLIALFLTSSASALEDDAGRRIDLPSPPRAIVSLLPSVTEVICALDASDVLAGVTYHDTHFPGLAGKPSVGGAFTPQFDMIRELSPDLLIVAPRDFKRAEAERGARTYSVFVVDDSASLAWAEERIVQIGGILGKTEEAQRIVANDREIMETIRGKVARISPDRRQRVMHVTASNGKLWTTAADTFQAEYIRAAGGIVCDMPAGNGSIVPLTKEIWEKADPQLVYTCDTEYGEVMDILAEEPWRGVSAVKNGRIHQFPCALVCRAATHTGYFVAWLSSTIYTDEFADEAQLVHPQEILSERTIEIDIPYVKRAKIVESRLMDFVHRTLLIDFHSPQTIISTVEGERSGVATIGNSYSPTPTWGIYHKVGFEKSRADLYKVLGIKPENADIMFTGADMNNLSVKTASYRDMKVTAVVTAGVEGNALRTAKDVGKWYEPGTINIVVMTNHRLSEQAATRAIVTVTEAKTSALWDMDIRSVQTPLENPATGTGTDTVIIVPGEGVTLHWTGGHAKMGQLIAETVYVAVQDALLKQNGKAPIRSVFERLAERGLQPHRLAGGPAFPKNLDRRRFQLDFERILLTPRYAAFVESALSLSDAQLMGQVSNLTAFESWAASVAGEIAGRPVARVERVCALENVPSVLRVALDAIATGLKYRYAETVSLQDG